MGRPIRLQQGRARPRHVRLAGIAILGVLLALVAVPWQAAAEACAWPTITFRWGGERLPGSADADLRWETPSNWDRDRVPTGTDRVCIPAWPHGSPEVSGHSVGGVIDASDSRITLRGGSLTVTESLAAETLVLHDGELRGPGSTDVHTLQVVDTGALDLLADGRLVGWGP